MNYLFVCTYNINRSVAAAKVFSELLLKYDIEANIRDAGISETAKNRITKELINWADKIYVMQNIHKTYIENIVPKAREKINVLGIEDIYQMNDPNLLLILKRKFRKEIMNGNITR